MRLQVVISKYGGMWWAVLYYKNKITWKSIGFKTKSGAKKAVAILNTVGIQVPPVIKKNINRISNVK